MKEGTPRFLVLRGGAIGDFVLSLPVFQVLRERWPGCHIELAGYPHIAELGRAGGLVDKVVSLDRADMASWFIPGVTLAEPARERLRGFDVILSYLYDPDGVVRDNLLAAGARQVIRGDPVVREGHAVDFFLRPLGELALFVEGVAPRLTLDATVLAAGQDWLTAHLGRPALALHAGSGGRDKVWPPGRFIEVAASLRLHGWYPFFILGEADREAVRALDRSATRYPCLTGRTLLEVAGVLAGCEGYLGNDSGISHLAAALGLPGLALFGPSDAARWAPRGDRFGVLQAPGGRLDALASASVVEHLLAGL